MIFLTVITKNVLGKTYMQCVSSDFETHFAIRIIKVNIHQFLPPQFKQFVLFSLGHCFSSLFAAFLHSSLSAPLPFICPYSLISVPSFFTAFLYSILWSVSTHYRLPYKLWAFRRAKKELFAQHVSVFTWVQRYEWRGSPRSHNHFGVTLCTFKTKQTQMNKNKVQNYKGVVREAVVGSLGAEETELASVI